MGNATKLGKPGEALFKEWYETRAKNGAVFFGLKTAETWLDDKTVDKEYGYVADQDYLIKDTATDKIIQRHEVKTYGEALWYGNLNFQIAFASKEDHRDHGWAVVRECTDDKNPETGEPVKHFTSIAGTYKTGIEGSLPPPDYFHFYLPVTDEITPAPEAITPEESAAFKHITPCDGEREQRKLITEAPVGIWMSLEYVTYTTLHELADATPNIFDQRDRTSDEAKEHKRLYGEYPLKWSVNNYNTSLIMVAEEQRDESDIHFRAMTKYVKTGEAKINNRVAVLPVVKCSKPEILQPDIFSYYMPRRLYDIAMNYRYKLENLRVKSGYANKEYSARLRTRLLDALDAVRVF